MNALVLSGGGSLGAFQVGALKTLVLDENRSYDIYSGTSVGALNCGFLSQFPGSSIRDGVKALEDIWLYLEESDVYTSWWGIGVLAALFKKSVYNSRPLKKLISKHICPSDIATILRISAVSLDTGELSVFTEQDKDIILDGIYASASFPFMFEPTKIKGQWMSDGGLRDITPLKAAIDAGATHIDIINCSTVRTPFYSVEKKSALKILPRLVDIITNEIMRNDIEVMHNINSQVELGTVTDKRYISWRLIEPNRFTYLPNSLDFNPFEIAKLIQAGQRDSVLSFSHTDRTGIVTRNN